MAWLFKMRLSKADTPPDQLCRNPVKDSAPQRLPNAREQTPQSGSHGSQKVTQPEDDLVFSNFALSIKDEDPIPVSRLPVANFPSNLLQPRHWPDLNSNHPSASGHKPSQHTRGPYHAPSRVSVFRSSIGSANGQDDLRPFRTSQSSDVHPYDVRLHTNLVKWSDAQRISTQGTYFTQINEDTTAGAEATQQWKGGEVCFVSEIQSAVTDKPILSLLYIAKTTPVPRRLGLPFDRIRPR